MPGFRYQELPLLFHQVSFLVAALFIQTTVDVEDEKKHAMNRSCLFYFDLKLRRAPLLP